MAATGAALSTLPGPQAILRHLPAVAVPPLCVATWLAAGARVDLGGMSDLGLVSVLPPAFFVVVAALVAHLVLLLADRAAHPVAITVHFIALALILFGTPDLAEQLPRFAASWRHAGVVEAIMRTGEIDPRIDAYFNWPGFFILGALVTEAAGLADPIALVDWAAVCFNLLYLPPLLLLLRAATTDTRIVWFAVLLFYLANWVGQDYFSPQAFNYLLYLTILAILVTWFKVPRPGSTGVAAHATRGGLRASLRAVIDSGPDGVLRVPDARTRAVLVAIVVVLFAASVASHQLTPFALLFGVTGAVLLRRLEPRGLPVIMAVMIAAWMTYMAHTWFAGHLEALTSDLGQVGANVGENVGSRLHGSSEHQFVVYARLSFTLVIWALAVVGAFVRLRQGYRDWTMAVLGAAPFALLAVQGYGGEVLLRAYLFALPFAAFFGAAAAVAALGPAVRAWRLVAVTAITVAMAWSLFVVRYGNERMDYVTQHEFAAVRRMYEVAPPGSLLVAITPSVPWKYRDYERYDYAIASREGIATALDASAVVEMVASRETAGYLILTRGQRAYAEMIYGARPHEWSTFAEEVAASPGVRIVYENADAQVFAISKPGSKVD